MAKGKGNGPGFGDMAAVGSKGVCHREGGGGLGVWGGECGVWRYTRRQQESSPEHQSNMSR